MKVYEILILLALFLCFARERTCSSQEVSSKTTPDIRSQYLESITKVEALFATIRGSGKLTKTTAVGTPREHVDTYLIEFARKPGSYRSVTKRIRDVGVSNGDSLPLYRAALFNNIMSAKLEKRSEDSSYVLVSSGENNLRSQLEISGGLRNILNCAFALTGPTISEYLARPDYTITRVDDVEQDSKALKRISFKMKQAGDGVSKTGRGVHIDHGWLLVSPGEKWVLYSAELVFTPSPDGKSGRIQLISVNYSGNHQGTPVPSRVQFRTQVRVFGDKKEIPSKNGLVLRDGAITASEVFEFDRLSFEDSPDSDFSLSAFQLPDLGTPGRSLTRRGYVPTILAFAVVTLILAVLLKYYASRTRRRSFHGDNRV